MKKIRYLIEAATLHLLFFIFGLMPVETASNIGGWLARKIGPRLAASRKAYRNLNKALPDLSPEQQRDIISQMWDNLGRTLCEYPHLKKISQEKIEVSGLHFIEEPMQAKKGLFLFSAHIANWEILGPALLARYNAPLDLTYRAPNNPWVETLLQKARSIDERIVCYPKSRTGGRDLMQAMKQGRHIGMLIDQKYNEGIAVDFFGMKAMTNPAFVQLCQKYNYPLVPAQNKRLKGATFQITIHEPLQLFDTEGKPRPVEDVISEAHRHLERWIKEDPGQWLWLHRRWDSKELKINLF